MFKRIIKIAVIVVVAICLLGTAFFIYLQEFHSTEIYCEYAPDNGYYVTVYQIGSPQWSFGPVTTKIVLRDADGKTVDKCTFELNNDGGSVNVINIADIRWKDFGVEVDMHGADDKGVTTYSLSSSNHNKDQFSGETSSETVRESIPNLNMATLKSLVDICGEDLTWDTFAPYWNKDVGSGIYILRYPIDEDYCLVISGASMEEPPEKIILEAVHSPENFIDIRTESIDDFIASGVAANATAMAKENALNIALKHCKTNYDYTTIGYNVDANEWDVEFWENGAKIAAQGILLDKDGKVLSIRYAE